MKLSSEVRAGVARARRSVSRVKVNLVMVSFKFFLGLRERQLGLANKGFF